MNNTQTKNCITCNTEFTKKVNCSRNEWAQRKYCSHSCQAKYWVGKPSRHKVGSKNKVPAWNKGQTGVYTAWNKGKGEYAKALGFGKWMTRKKQSEETRRKKSEAAMKNIDAGLHNFYIDGRTPERMVIRHSLDYKLWREAVFKRDDFTCKDCKQRGCYLEAHHIKPFSLFPELRFAIDNGVTLCTACHAKVDILRARTLTKQT